MKKNGQKSLNYVLDEEQLKIMCFAAYELGKNDAWKRNFEEWFEETSQTINRRR